MLMHQLGQFERVVEPHRDLVVRRSVDLPITPPQLIYGQSSFQAGPNHVIDYCGLALQSVLKDAVQRQAVE